MAKPHRANGENPPHPAVARRRRPQTSPTRPSWTRTTGERRVSASASPTQTGVADQQAARSEVVPRGPDADVSEHFCFPTDKQNVAGARRHCRSSSQAGATDAAIDALAHLRMRNYRGLANPRLQIARGNELSLSSLPLGRYYDSHACIDQSCDLFGSAERLSGAAT